MLSLLTPWLCPESFKSPLKLSDVLTFGPDDSNDLFIILLSWHLVLFTLYNRYSLLVHC